MPCIYIPFWIPEEVVDRLRTGEYERKGGVIRRSDNKRIVMWLKQEGQIPEGGIPKVLFRIIAHSWDLEELTDQELIELGRYINNHPELSGMSFYSGSKGAVAAIVDKFDKYLNEGREEEAKRYAQEKRRSLLNIFEKTYIPNLKHWIELGRIQMVYNEDEDLLDFLPVQK